MFFAFGAAHWALLPLLARQTLGGGPGLYGLMLAGIGVGAVGGAVALPWLRERLGGPEGLMLAGALGGAAAQAGLALVASEAVAVALCVLAGVAWIAVLTTLNATAQAVLPDWVRGPARALPRCLLRRHGAGEVAWGQAAASLGIPGALLAAAGGGLAAALLGRALPLPSGEEVLDPSRHWPDPQATVPVEPERGPVGCRWSTASRPSGRRPSARRSRLSAESVAVTAPASWGVFTDAEDPSRVVEWFVLASWAERLCQHGRVTVADRTVQEAVEHAPRGARATARDAPDRAGRADAGDDGSQVGPEGSP